MKAGRYMVVDYEAIGIRIRIARIKLKMTQETLANKVGLSAAHMSNIETGNTKVGLPSLINIANALSVSVDDLLCDTVAHSGHVFKKELQEILADCSPQEVRILVDVLKSTKEALRKEERFKADLENPKKK